MDARLRARLELLLLAERARTTKTLHQIETDEAAPQAVTGGATTRTELTPAEAASDVQEEEMDFMTATRASAHLAVVDEALRTLAADPDSLGHCQRCGYDIERARLELVPWSRLCTLCARAQGRTLRKIFDA